MPPHILDRNTHKSRGSDGASSIASNTAPSITAPTHSGATTLVEPDNGAGEQRARENVDQVCRIAITQ